MKIDIAIIKILDLIDRYGSISKAADILGKVPSGLSHTIAKAERRVKAKLLLPEGRSVVVSPVGMALLEDGRKLLYNLEKLERKVINYESGLEEEFVIGIDENINSTPLVQLIAKYYFIEPRSPITLISRPSSLLIPDLINRKIHFIIGQNIDKASANKNIMSRQLMSSPMVLAIGKNHPLEQKLVGIGEDIHSYPWPSINWVSVYKYDAFLYPNDLRPYINSTMVMPNSLAQIKAISQGLGVGLIPEVKLTEFSNNITVLYRNTSWNEVYYAAWNTMRMEKSLRWFIRQLDNVYTRTALVSNKDIITITGVE